MKSLSPKLRRSSKAFNHEHDKVQWCEGDSLIPVLEMVDYDVREFGVFRFVSANGKVAGECDVNLALVSIVSQS